MSKPLPNYFRLGHWLIDVDHNLVTLNHTTSKLEPKAMLVLQYLAAHPQQTVSREAIFTACWPNQVVSEDALNRVISSIRKKLASDTSTPHYITTVRNAGYKLIVPITEESNPRFTQSSSPVATASEPSLGVTKSFNRYRAIAFILLIATLLMLADAWFHKRLDTMGDAKQDWYRFSYNSGQNAQPSFSNNGQMLAFIERQIDQVNQLKLRRLPANFAGNIGLKNYSYSHPVFFDNDQQIIAVAKDRRSNQQQIIAININTLQQRTLKTLSVASQGLSSHGSQPLFAYTQPTVNSTNPNHGVYVWDNEQQKGRAIYLPDEGHDVSRPKFAPNGDLIGFIDQKSPLQSAVFVTDLNGKTQQLTDYAEYIYDFTWVDTQTLIINRRGELIQVSLDGNVAIELPFNHSQSITDLAYSQAEGQLVVATKEHLSSARITNLMAKNGHFNLTQAEANDTESAVSQRGKTLAFVSNRTGKNSLWLRQQHQLSSIVLSTADHIYDLSWNPNGQQIAAAFKTGSDYGIYVYDIETEQLVTKALTNKAIHLIDWKDAHTLLYSQQTAGNWNLTNLHVDEQMQISTSSVEHSLSLDVYQARLTPDKQRLIYLTKFKNQFFSWDFTSTPQPLGHAVTHIDRNWYIDQSHIYALKPARWVFADNRYLQRSELIKLALDEPSQQHVADLPPALPQHRPQGLLYGLTFAQESAISGDFWQSNLR